MEKNDILFIHGTGYKEMTMRILEVADLKTLIGDTGKSIALKPNLVTTTPPEDGATTHAEILDGTIAYLKDHGFSDICVMEGSWAGSRTSDAMQICYYDRICKAHEVPFHDLKKDTYTKYDAKGMDIAVCDRAMRTDFLINLPVLKGHCQTKVTCALKNMKGILPDFEKRRFHTLGLHKPIAHLNTVRKQDFILVDNICGDLEFEEGGNPVVMNRLLAFLDPVLCDAFVCESMGFAPDEVPYVKLAEQLGVGSTDLKNANKIHVNEPSEENAGATCGTAETTSSGYFFKRSGRVDKLKEYTAPKDACSACYGALIRALCRMREHGTLLSLKESVAIGQGYRGETGRIGCGNCTAGFETHVPGCPPTAAEVLRILED